MEIDPEKIEGGQKKEEIIVNEEEERLNQEKIEGGYCLIF